MNHRSKENILTRDLFDNRFGEFFKRFIGPAVVLILGVAMSSAGLRGGYRQGPQWDFVWMGVAFALLGLMFVVTKSIRPTSTTVRQKARTIGIIIASLSCLAFLAAVCSLVFSSVYG